MSAAVELSVIRRTILTITIVCFGIAALLGIAVLIGATEIDETQGRVILTTVAFGCASLCALCYLAPGRRMPWTGVVGGVAALAALVLALVLIWADLSETVRECAPGQGGECWEQERSLPVFDDLLKALGAAIVVAGTVAQLSLVLASAWRVARLRWLVWATFAVATLLGLEIVALIYIGEHMDSELWARTLGVLAILDVLGTVVTLAIAWFGSRGGTAIEVRVPAELGARLRTLSEATGRPADELVAQAVRELLGEDEDAEGDEGAR